MLELIAADANKPVDEAAEKSEEANVAREGLGIGSSVYPLADLNESAPETGLYLAPDFASGINVGSCAANPTDDDATETFTFRTSQDGRGPTSPSSTTPSCPTARSPWSRPRSRTTCATSTATGSPSRPRAAAGPLPWERACRLDHRSIPPAFGERSSPSLCLTSRSASRTDLSAFSLLVSSRLVASCLSSASVEGSPSQAWSPAATSARIASASALSWRTSTALRATASFAARRHSSKATEASSASS